MNDLHKGASTEIGEKHLKLLRHNTTMDNKEFQDHLAAVSEQDVREEIYLTSGNYFRDQMALVIRLSQEHPLLVKELQSIQSDYDVFIKTPKEELVTLTPSQERELQDTGEELKVRLNRLLLGGWNKSDSEIPDEIKDLIRGLVAIAATLKTHIKMVVTKEGKLKQQETVGVYRDDDSGTQRVDARKREPRPTEDVDEVKATGKGGKIDRR
jgi:hypothetical protein